jgi:hypothetical protein
MEVPKNKSFICKIECFPFAQGFHVFFTWKINSNTSFTFGKSLLCIMPSFNSWIASLTKKENYIISIHANIFPNFFPISCNKLYFGNLLSNILQYMGSFNTWLANNLLILKIWCFKFEHPWNVFKNIISKKISTVLQIT